MPRNPLSIIYTDVNRLDATLFEYFNLLTFLLWTCNVTYVTGYRLIIYLSELLDKKAHRGGSRDRSWGEGLNSS